MLFRSSPVVAERLERHACGIAAVLVGGQAVLGWVRVVGEATRSKRFIADWCQLRCQFTPVAVNVAVKRDKSAARCLPERADLNLYLCGSRAWIRTRVGGFKGPCPTTERPGIAVFKDTRCRLASGTYSPASSVLALVSVAGRVPVAPITSGQNLAHRKLGWADVLRAGRTGSRADRE